MKKESCHLGSVQFECIINNLLSINGICFYIYFIYSHWSRYFAFPFGGQSNSFAFTNCIDEPNGHLVKSNIIAIAQLNQWNHYVFFFSFSVFYFVCARNPGCNTNILTHKSQLHCEKCEKEFMRYDKEIDFAPHW